MSKQVWKFDVPVDDRPHRLTGPFLAREFRPVHVACQDRPGAVQVWVEVDDTYSDAVADLQVYATGQNIPSGARHVGSTVTAGGALVWHVYSLLG